MINKQDFRKLRKEIELYENKRENLIRKSRDIVRLSKQIIYSIHRDDLKKANTLITQINKKLKDLEKIGKTSPRLLYSGPYKIAEQEAVEAICFYSIIKNKKLLTKTAMGVKPEHYILGICDLTGEIVRKAINFVIKGDFKTPLLLKDFVYDIYHELQLFDALTNELRRKIDGVKYNLKKLEEISLQIKLK